MNTNQLNELKGEIKQYIDLVDAEVVEMVHAVLRAHVENNWWHEMPNELKKDWESIYGPEEEVMTYEQVKKAYPQWFMN